MKARGARLAVLILAVCVAILAVWFFRSGPSHPIALLRVVDAAGRPVAGAIIRPDGIRTKPGPYASGHYGWRTGQGGVSDAPVSTDTDGSARVPYPTYAFE